MTLQVQEKAEDVAAPLLAAQQKKETAKEAVRQQYAASGPARQSQRAGAKHTRAKLQKQAEELAKSESDDRESISSGAKDSDEDEEPMSRDRQGRVSQKRKCTAQEADYDPAGDAASTPLMEHMVTCVI